MIFVELFYHCDHYGCEAHAYVPGDPIDGRADSARIPKELPAHWTWDPVGDKVYCAQHSKESHDGEAAV